MVIVVGSTTSSNSNRLREVAESCGVPAHLIMSPDEVDTEWQKDETIGVTSGASTPERLVEDIVGKILSFNPEAVVTTLATVDEDVTFIPPRDLIASASAS
jgi:4-hydroxy-3-methylbut-2-enyl diphosphate reductase